MHSSKLFLFINGFFFYFYWWICFWGASNDQYYIGPFIAILYFIFHFIIIDEKMKEFKLILIYTAYGFVLESLFYYTRFINYKGILPENFSIVPFWVLILWAGSSLTIFHSFKWIHKKYFLTFFFGGCFGPLIYLSGHIIGCISFQYNIGISYLILFFIWSFSFTILNYISVIINEN